MCEGREAKARKPGRHFLRGVVHLLGSAHQGQAQGVSQRAPELTCFPVPAREQLDLLAAVAEALIFLQLRP